MKCKSCGKEVRETDNVCENCGFDLQAFKKQERILVEEDPDLPKSKKSTLIDSPIITFALGVISVLIALTIISYQSVIIFFVILEVMAVLGTFFASAKVCKVSLRPVRNVGVVLAYIGLALTIFKIAYVILS
ncbi:MAG: zinc-ribbon domain-containing protein [Bacilli bacterium]|nr:zinc-ribbon domain-containing protein [Bacilli bacterium]